jgi:hypothetical protein
MMDANEHIRLKPGGLTTIMGKVGMVNLVQFCHPNIPEPNTHMQGSTRIDYIFGTKQISQCCKHAGILPFGTGYISDHQPLFTSIEIAAVLESNVKPVESITARKLHQATPRECDIFLQEANLFLENLQTYKRLQGLMAKQDWMDQDTEEFERCNDELIQGMLYAEQRTGKLKTTPWLPKFASAVSKKSFWKIAFSLKINHRYPNEDFIWWAESLGIADIKAIKIATIKKQFRLAQKELRNVEKEAAALREQHLHSMLTNAELNGDEKAIQQRLKILIHAHEQRNHFQ